jgi:hypothetical protein
MQQSPLGVGADRWLEKAGEGRMSQTVSSCLNAMAVLRVLLQFALYHRVPQ